MRSRIRIKSTEPCDAPFCCAVTCASLLSDVRRACHPRRLASRRRLATMTTPLRPCASACRRGATANLKQQPYHSTFLPQRTNFFIDGALRGARSSLEHFSRTGTAAKEALRASILAMGILLQYSATEFVEPLAGRNDTIGMTDRSRVDDAVVAPTRYCNATNATR
jgi:hypothetical protein